MNATAFVNLIFGFALVFAGLALIVRGKGPTGQEPILTSEIDRRKRRATTIAPLVILFGAFKLFTGVSQLKPGVDFAAREYVHDTLPILKKYSRAEEPMMRPIRRWLIETPVTPEEFDEAFETVQAKMAEVRQGIESISVPETDNATRWQRQLALYMNSEEGRISAYYEFMRSRIGIETPEESEAMNEAVEWLADQERSQQKMAAIMSKVANECAN